MRAQLDHTADVGIEIKSDTFQEALSEACLALTEIITGGNLVKPSKELNFKITYSDSSHLLVDILNELIVLFDSENFLSGQARITLSDSEATVFLSGDTYSPEKYGYGVEVKAISYHNLKVTTGPPSHIVFILDL
ncbi:MAG: hypothetical protein BEU04_01380 [Marine Group III euryarchaeote CG-Bathy1]|uniref:Archease domain-containing protein n=1 Tax=Marine Group III euryarchaeote CG-Bathy1 TaxID=1889001 RepID=A0A1J5TKA6_9ARCH|nr:MAG: hypothetical protein BEU04_01380 [Marine Group III euryarchaeote CG-Bathy1]